MNGARIWTHILQILRVENAALLQSPAVGKFLTHGQSFRVITILKLPAPIYWLVVRSIELAAAALLVIGIEITADPETDTN